MATDTLAFWLHPDWLGDSRDNPRDPNHEPFWMRDPCQVEALYCLGDETGRPIPVAFGTVRARRGIVTWIDA